MSSVPRPDLTTRLRDLGIRPRIVELGRIKIGKLDEQERKAASGRTYHAPQKLDHFLIQGFERDSKGILKNDHALMEKLLAAHGVDDVGPDGKPMRKLKELPIALLSDDVDDCMTSRWAYYDSRTLAAECDGKTCTWYRKRNGELVPEGLRKPCDKEHERPDDKGKPRFKLHSTFQCVIASSAARWGGVYKLRTTSEITAEQLYGSLAQVQVLTAGILQGLPLWLVVRPMEVSPDGKATTVYVVHVELRGADLATVQQQAILSAQVRNANHRQLQQVQAELRQLIARPETQEEQAETAQEFHPGPENGKPAEKAPEPVAQQQPAPAQAPASEQTVEVKAGPATATGRKVQMTEEPATAAPPVAVVPPAPLAGAPSPQDADDIEI